MDWKTSCVEILDVRSNLNLGLNLEFMLIDHLVRKLAVKHLTLPPEPGPNPNLEST